MAFAVRPTSHMNRLPKLMLIALCAAPTHAESLTKDEAIKLFTDANRAYDEGETAAANKDAQAAVKSFEAAARTYEALLNAGFQNGQIFFNLGNTHYRLGKPGKAIANYLRAQRLVPRDAAVAANLRQANRLVDEVAPNSGVPELVSLVFFWYFYLNVDELLGVTLIAYGVLVALLLACIFSRQTWVRRVAIAGAVVFVVLAASLALQFRRDVLTERGVVTAEEINVRYGNGAHHTVKFNVHEGAQCIVRDQRADDDGRVWINATFLVDVKTRDDNEAASAERRTGWIPADAVEMLTWRTKPAPKPGEKPA